MKVNVFTSILQIYARSLFIPMKAYKPIFSDCPNAKALQSSGARITLKERDM